MTYIKNSLFLLLCVSSLWGNAQNTSISGNISTAFEVPLANVGVTIKNGNFTLSSVTNAEGNYKFENLTETENITIEFELQSENNHPLNGVSTLDYVVTARHILGVTPFEEAYKYIAMDLNGSGNITAFDLVQLRQVILGIATEFANNTAWRFVEKTALANLNFSQANNPEYDDIVSSPLNLTTGENTVVDMVGIKIGDANGNAATN